MNKESYMEYATTAFIEFYKMGCPTRKEYEERIRQKIYKEYSLCSPDRILKKAETEIARNAALLDVIEAVNRTFDMLYGKIPLAELADRKRALQNGEDIAEAVKFVYFGLHRGKPSHARIKRRVRMYAATLPTNERTVYRRLKMARKLFAFNCNLMTGEEEIIYVDGEKV